MVFHFVKATGDGGCKCCETCGDYDVICYNAVNGSVVRCQYHGHGGYNLNEGRDVHPYHNKIRISVSNYDVIVASETSLTVASVDDSGEAIPIQKSVGTHEFWMWTQAAANPFVGWPLNYGDPYFIQGDQTTRYEFDVSRTPKSNGKWWVSWEQKWRAGSNGLQTNLKHVGYTSLSYPHLRSIITYGDFVSLGFSRDDSTSVWSPAAPATHSNEHMRTIDPNYYSDVVIPGNQVWWAKHVYYGEVTGFRYYFGYHNSVGGHCGDFGYEDGNLLFRGEVFSEYFSQNDAYGEPSGFVAETGLVTGLRQHSFTVPIRGTIYDGRRSLKCLPVIYAEPGTGYAWAANSGSSSNGDYSLGCSAMTGVKNAGHLWVGGPSIGSGVYGSSALRDAGMRKARYRTGETTNGDGDTVAMGTAEMSGPFCLHYNQGESGNKTYLYAAGHGGDTLTGYLEADPLFWKTVVYPPIAPVFAGATGVRFIRMVIGLLLFRVVDMDDQLIGFQNEPYPKLVKTFTSPFGTKVINGISCSYVPQDLFTDGEFLYAMLADEEDPFEWRRICKYRVGVLGLELIWTITPEHDWQVFHSFYARNSRVWAAVSASDGYVFANPAEIYPPLTSADAIPAEDMDPDGWDPGA